MKEKCIAKVKPHSTKWLLPEEQEWAQEISMGAHGSWKNFKK